jgi:DNA-binding LacI/PurR family transcriptional regulator
MNVSVDNRDFLYRQVQNWLVEQIRLGKLKPGSRLPGERSLAEKLKISRATARLALQELEKAGTIDRIPSKGAFISTKKKQRKLRLALLYPEAEISLNNLNYANWAASSEIQRGALSACGKNNTTLTFQHVPINSDTDEFVKNLIMEYDGALFIGYQLKKLKQSLREQQFPCFTLSEEDQYKIIYDRDEICEIAAKHLYTCGCRNIHAITGNLNGPSFVQKINKFREIFDLPENNVIEISMDEENCYNELKRLIPEDSARLPDAFFCTTQIIPFALLRLAQERNWRVPEDFMIMGYGNNMEIRPTNPTLTHVKIPYFETGRIGTEIMIQNILGGTPLPEEKLISAELIIGKTTYIKKSTVYSPQSTARRDKIG